jgi:membrane-bound metal-dependent hydrolase YbcI (DUF457 family)
MNKIGHLCLGIFFGVVLILLTHHYLGWFDFKTLVGIGLIVIIVYVYSLIPEIDMKNSAVTWTFIPIGIIASVTGYMTNNKLYLIGGLALLTITFLAAQFLPHRGFTHSIFFGIIVSLPWMYVSWDYVALAFVCFYSHLAADSEFFKIV